MTTCSTNPMTKALCYLLCIDLRVKLVLTSEYIAEPRRCGEKNFVYKIININFINRFFMLTLHKSLPSVKEEYTVLG